MAQRTYLSQSDVPAHRLEEALRVPMAIADNYGKQPTRPIAVAEAMGLTPGSSRFRMLCGASIAYGLTDGGYNADVIALTALGRRIVAPTEEGDDTAARREALLRPRVIRDFLTRYDGSKLPRKNIARNVLEELSVPPDRTMDTYELIAQGASSVGFIREMKGNQYVDLAAASPLTAPPSEGENNVDRAEEDALPSGIQQHGKSKIQIDDQGPAIRKSGRVFITHGKNHAIVDQLKELLTFGGFTPVVAIEQETVSKPVPDKVLDEMRTCAAAIIHVDAEKHVLDEAGNKHPMLNQNVLIEIGAAMALYGRKFILLVENGVKLPSNLQGLYEVRFSGAELGYDSTMKLLKAFNDFRN